MDLAENTQVLGSIRFAFDGRGERAAPFGGGATLGRDQCMVIVPLTHHLCQLVDEIVRRAGLMDRDQMATGRRDEHGGGEVVED